MKLQAKVKYPDKTVLNLVIKERRPAKVMRTALFLLLMLILAGLFSKFAVADRLNAVSAAQADYYRSQRQLTELRRFNEAYDSVQLEYARYFSAELDGSDTAAADIIKAMNIVELIVMKKAVVSSYDLSGSELTINIVNTDLSAASSLIKELNTDPAIESVRLYTVDAGASGTKHPNITMTITLMTAEGDEQLEP